jgi:pentatricopeptide repeat protein
MYAKCGELSKAELVLRDTPARDVVCWSALIAGYAQQGHGYEALDCFERMLGEGLSPDAIAFTSILKACGKTGAIDKGKEIHDEIVRRGLLQKDIMLGTALVDMYAKCGVLRKAQQVLEELPFRNVVTWSVLIAGCVQHGENHEALNYFERMQSEGLFPDVVTFVCILKACGSIGAIDMGQRIHDEVASKGLLPTEVVLGTALIDMYAKCGMLKRAKQVLEELLVRNVVSWSALISGYVQHGQGHEALACFEDMKHDGIVPDVVIFISILSACGSTCAIEKGKQVHDEIVGRGLLHKNIMLDNALVDMYAKCGMLGKAEQVLEELPARDVISWNALMAGYAQQEQWYEAFGCFERM